MRSWVGYVSWLLIFLVVGIELASTPYIDLGYESPGIGIATIALLDGFILYAWTIKMFSPILTAGIQIPVVKISDFIVALLLLITCVLVIISAILFTTLLIALLLAFPFGTAAYMIEYAGFKTGTAQTTLAAIMSLKCLFAVSIVIAEKRLFQYYRSLILVILCSFLCNVVVSLLHTIVPGFLASITDAIAAIVVAIIALIWIFISFIPSLLGIVSLILDFIGAIFRTVDP